jgi:hypothetical protein
MTTDHPMAAMYAAQQEVIAALTEVGEVERWLAAHLPICCMCLVPATDDPFMVVWHANGRQRQPPGALPSSRCTCRLACLTPFAGCDVGCAMCAIERRGIGIDGATCAASVWPAVITRHW